jgi:Flp pilus assembly protein TadD
MADKERRLIKFLIALAAIAITFTGPYPEEVINYQSEYNNLLGKSAVQSGRFSEGRILYAKASSLEPSYDDPHYNMGCLFLRAGLNDSAATHFVKATMANPSHKRSLINLYYLYQVMGDTAKSDSLLLFNSSILLSEPDVAEDWNKRK